MGPKDDVKLISSFWIEAQGIDVIIEVAQEKGGVRVACEIRSKIVIRLVKELGVPLAKIGRQLGITTSLVSKVLSKKGVD